MYFPLTGIFRYPVEAYTASWIEMDPATGKDHTVSVEAYTASWIEIPIPKRHNTEDVSRLIQPRGLKFYPKQTDEREEVSRLIQPRGLKCTMCNRMVRLQSRGLCDLVD